MLCAVLLLDHLRRKWGIGVLMMRTEPAAIMLSFIIGSIPKKYACLCNCAQKMIDATPERCSLRLDGSMHEIQQWVVLAKHSQFVLT